MAGIAVCWLAATRRSPALPVVVATLLVPVSLVLVVVVAIRVLLDPPSVHLLQAGGANVLEARPGAYVGLVLSVVVARRCVTSRCGATGSRPRTRRRCSRRCASRTRAHLVPPRIRPMLERQQVDHVARLAQLELSDAEAEKMAVELSKVLDHIEAIRELDLEGVEPTSHVIDVVNALRADVPEPLT